MTITQIHTLTVDEAKQRIDGFLSQLQQQYAGKIKNPVKTWTGDTMRFRFVFQSFPIAGRIDVENRLVTLKGELPMLAMIFQEEIRQTIQKEMKKLLIQ
jgi:hypothetical protein